MPLLAAQAQQDQSDCPSLLGAGLRSVCKALVGTRPGRSRADRGRAAVRFIFKRGRIRLMDPRLEDHPAGNSMLQSCPKRAPTAKAQTQLGAPLHTRSFTNAGQ
jgi:hypothetical protein